ncbi:Efem/EfeO family lipoprotein [Frankliniella fusca]|uniref:Efem/EfeO family lipoprotein n=1 Tax=Frankliniella fusca TaxID=407009 RepID=A0AAE1H9A4_9NEOP|nr:Efem/EfeO family lipoprotein [Frankliniella fusca]
MAKDIGIYCKSCRYCQLHKSDRQKTGLLNPVHRWGLVCTAPSVRMAMANLICILILFLQIPWGTNASWEFGDPLSATTETSVRLSTGLHAIETGKIAAEGFETMELEIELGTVPFRLIRQQSSYLTGYFSSVAYDSRVAAATWNKTVNQILDNIILDRKEQNLRFKSKRGLAFMGSVFSWCCDIVTEHSIAPVVTDMQNFHSSLEQLKSAQSSLHNSLNRTILTFRNFSVDVQKSFDVIRHEMTEYKYTQHQTTQVTRNNVYMSKLNTILLQIVSNELAIRTALSDCRRGVLSLEVVPVERLTEKIDQLMSLAPYRGFQLAVENVEQLYLEKLTTCQLTDEKLKVWLKIPLKTVNTEWKIISFWPIPFAWEETLCRLFQGTEPVLAATNKDVVVPLTGPELKHCKENNVCQVPRIEGSYTTVGQCLRDFYSGRTAAELAKSCPFHCKHSSTPEILQLAADQFIVASAGSHAISVRCGKFVTRQNSLGFGSFRFTVPGNCTLSIDNNVAVNKRVTMPRSASTVHGVEFVLPAVWTTRLNVELDSIRDFPNAPKFVNDDKILNSSWPLHTTTFLEPDSLPAVNIKERHQLGIVVTFVDCWDVGWATKLFTGHTEHFTITDSKHES